MMVQIDVVFGGVRLLDNAASSVQVSVHMAHVTWVLHPYA